MTAIRPNHLSFGNNTLVLSGQISIFVLIKCRIR